MKNPKFESLDLISGRTVNPGKCVGIDKIDIDSTIKALDISICSQTPRYAIMTLESDVTGVGIRYMIDGVNPGTGPSGKGIPKYDTSVWTIISTEDLVRFRVIEEASGTQVLWIEYYA